MFKAPWVSRRLIALQRAELCFHDNQFAATFRGLPPFFPFVRAAAAFAVDVVRPALAAIHLAVPKMPLARPGTV